MTKCLGQNRKTLSDKSDEGCICRTSQLSRCKPKREISFICLPPSKGVNVIDYTICPRNVSGKLVLQVFEISGWRHLQVGKLKILTEILKILTKSTWKWKFLITVMEISFLIIIIISGIIIIIIHFMWKMKNVHYASIMLDAPNIALCPKLCPHNPTH